MRALLLTAEPEGAGFPLERDLLGMSLGLRQLLSLADAGAECIEVAGPGAEVLMALSTDGRLEVPVERAAGQAGECLVLAPQALVSADVLRSLEPGEAVRGPEGIALAGHMALADTGDAAAALSDATSQPIESDRYRWGLRVSDAPSVRRAKRSLLAALVKPSDGPVSKNFNRHISLAITRVLLPMGLTPNQVTVLVLLLGVAGAWLASFGTWSFMVAGAAVYQLHSIVDGCDGEIARLTRRFGKHGALFDSLVDDLSNVLFWIGLSIGVARAEGVSWPLVTAGVTAVAYVGVIALQYGAVLRSTGRGDKTKFWKDEQKKPPVIVRAVGFLLRRDTFVLLILIVVALDGAPVLVAAFPVAALVTLAASTQRMLALRRA